MPPKGDYATTGPDNPLHAFTPEEQADLASATAASTASYAAFREARVALNAAKAKGDVDPVEIERLKTEMDKAEERAREDEAKEKALQDFCD
ncbi:hypothetical protein RQP46_003648 [Phenoliferia psychrophenolica]